MESESTVDRSSDDETTADADNSNQQVAHLDTHRLSAVGQGTVVSVDTSAGSALRPQQHDPVEGKGSYERTHYISSRLDYLDIHSGRVGTVGGTKSKDLSRSPTSMLALQPPQRLRSEEEASLDPTASRSASVQPSASLQTAGFDGSQETHTAVDSSTEQGAMLSATIGALQRGLGQVTNIPVSLRQAVIDLADSWREPGLIVSDQNVRPVNSDFVQHLPDTFSVSDLSQNNVRGGLQRSRSFYVENKADKKVIDEVVNKSELPRHPKLADGRALAAIDCARAGNFLPIPDERHDFQVFPVCPVLKVMDLVR